MKKIIYMIFLLFVNPLVCCADISINYTDKSGKETLDMIKDAFNSESKIYDKLIKPSVTNTPATTVAGDVSFNSTITCQNEDTFAKIKMTPNSFGQLQISGSIDENLDGIFESSIQASNVDVLCRNGAIINCEKGEFNESCQKCLWVKTGSITSLQCFMVVSDGSHVEVPISIMESCTYLSAGSKNVPGAMTKSSAKDLSLYLIAKASENNPSLSFSKLETSGALDQSVTIFAADTGSCLGNEDKNEIKNVVDIYNNDPWKLVNDDYKNSDSWDLFNSITPDYAGYEKCAISNRLDSRVVRYKTAKIAEYVIIWDRDGSSKDCVWGSPSGQCKQAYLYQGKNPKEFWQCRDAVNDHLMTICEDVYGQNYEILGYRDAHVAPGYNDPPGPESDLNDRFADGCNGAHDDDNGPVWQVSCEMYDNMELITCTSESMGKAGVVLVADTVPQSVVDDISGTISRFPKGKYQTCDIVQRPVSSCLELENDPKCHLVSSENDNVPTFQNKAVIRGYSPNQTCRIVGNVSPTLVCEDWWVQMRTYQCALGDTYDPNNLKKRTTTVVTGLENNLSDGKVSSIKDQTFENGVSQKTSYQASIVMDKNNEKCQTSCLVSKNIHTADLLVKSSEGDWSENGDEQNPDIDNFPLTASPHTSIYVETRDCTQSGMTYTCPVNATDGESVRYPCSCSESKEFVEVVSLMQMLRNLNDDVTCSSGTKTATICDATEDPTAPSYGPYVCGDFKYTTDGAVDPDTGERFIQKTELKSCEPVAKSGVSIPGQRFAAFLNDDYNCELASANVDGKGMNIKAVFPQYNPVLGAITSQRFWFDWAINYANGYIATGPDSALKPVDDCPCPPSFTTTTVEKPDGTYTCNYSKLPSSGIAVDYTGVKMNPSSEMPFGSVKISADASAKYSYTHKGICTPASSQCHILGWLGCPVEMASGPSPICHGWDGDPKYCNYYTCNITGKHYMFNDRCEDECVRSAECGISKISQVFTAGIVQHGSGNLWGRILNQNATVKSEFDIFIEGQILESCVDKFNVNTLNYTDAITGFVYKYTTGDYHIFANAAARGEQPYNKDETSKIELPRVPPVYNGGSQNIPARPMYKSKSIATQYQQANYGKLGALYISISPNTPTINYYQCPIGRVVKGSDKSICGADSSIKPQEPYSGIFNTIDGNYCYENQCDANGGIDGEMVYPGCGYANDGEVKYE